MGFKFVVIVATLMSLVVPTVFAQNVISGLEHMQRVQTALGGDVAFEEISSYFRKTTMSAKMSGMDIEFVIEESIQFPDRIHTKTITPFGKQIGVVVGESGWSIARKGEQDLNADEIGKKSSDLRLGFVGVFRQLEELQCTSLPPEAIEGIWYYAVQVSDGTHDPRNYYLDPDDNTVFMIATSVLHPIHRKMATRRIYIDDYQQLGGIRVPRLLHVTYDHEHFATITVDEFILNPVMDKALFTH